MRVTQPFGFAQGRESFDFAQDREPVERPVERQMGVFRQPLYDNIKAFGRHAGQHKLPHNATPSYDNPCFPRKTKTYSSLFISIVRLPPLDFA